VNREAVRGLPAEEDREESFNGIKKKGGVGSMQTEHRLYIKKGLSRRDVLEKKNVHCGGNDFNVEKERRGNAGPREGEVKTFSSRRCYMTKGKVFPESWIRFREQSHPVKRNRGWGKRKVIPGQGGKWKEFPQKLGKQRLSRLV